MAAVHAGVPALGAAGWLLIWLLRPCCWTCPASGLQMEHVPVACADMSSLTQEQPIYVI